MDCHGISVKYTYRLPSFCHSFRYMEEFSKLSIQDVESRKTIEITETSQTNINVPINNLS